MNILVIGNGFDLEHNLPTKYCNFIQFIKVFKAIPLPRERSELTRKLNEDRYYPYDIDIRTIKGFSELNKSIQEQLESIDLFEQGKYIVPLDEFKNCIDKNFWIEYFIDKTSREETKEKGWIDFECEISEVIKALDFLKNDYLKNRNKYGYDKISINDYKDIIYNVFEKLKKYYPQIEMNTFVGECAEKIIKRLTKDLNKMIRALEIYLYKFVSEIEINNDNKIIKSLKINRVLSFNYTDTYEKVYDKKVSEYNPIVYDYIHGKINSDGSLENNNMVLGIDEYLDEDEKNKNLDFIYLKKYFQRIYKKTGCEYKHWINDIIYNEYEPEEWNRDHNIYIFGHSLDVSDKDILRDIILGPCKEKEDIYRERTTINIYYYDKEAYANQIINLVKVIGQDELISRVHSENIVFLEQTSNNNLNE